MWTRPTSPSARNQTAVTGPNTFDTPPVPNRCTLNTPMMSTTVIGTIHRLRSGATICSPSTADSTEIAGVMMASPKNMAAPMTPAATMMRGALAKPLAASAISDSVPPSPLLSARMTKKMYLTVTVIVTAQTMSDSSPSTSVSAVAVEDETASACRKA